MLHATNVYFLLVLTITLAFATDDFWRDIRGSFQNVNRIIYVHKILLFTKFYFKNELIITGNFSEAQKLCNFAQLQLPSHSTFKKSIFFPERFWLNESCTSSRRNNTKTINKCNETYTVICQGNTTLCRVSENLLSNENQTEKFKEKRFTIIIIAAVSGLGGLILIIVIVITIVSVCYSRGRKGNGKGTGKPKISKVSKLSKVSSKLSSKTGSKNKKVKKPTKKLIEKQNNIKDDDVTEYGMSSNVFPLSNHK